MAGALAWPTTGAEVRPWFLFPQRWPPPPGPLPVPPGIPGWGPLSLHALLENISRFLSSHFIIFPPFPSPLFLLLLPFLYHSLLTSQEREDLEMHGKWTQPVGIKFHSRKKVFSSTVLLEETRFLRKLSLHVVRNLVNTLANHTCTNFSSVLSNFVSSLHFWNFF